VTIAAVQAQFAGFVLRLAGRVEAPVVGFDVLTAVREGRLHTVVGFLDRMPTG
jgi:hypothetical protein